MLGRQVFAVYLVDEQGLGRVIRQEIKRDGAGVPAVVADELDAVRALFQLGFFQDIGNRDTGNLPVADQGAAGLVDVAAEFHNLRDGVFFGKLRQA